MVVMVFVVGWRFIFLLRSLILGGLMAFRE